MTIAAATPDEPEPDDSQSELPAISREEERFEYWNEYMTNFRKTMKVNHGGQIEAARPHVAVKALMMLEQCESHKNITKACNMGWQSLNRFIERHTLTIQENRKQFSRKFAMAAEMGIDVMTKKFNRLMDDEESLDKTSPKDIALAVGILTDKGAMMDGMATQTIEVRRGASVGDAQAMIQAARERIAAKSQVVDAEIVDPEE